MKEKIASVRSSPLRLGPDAPNVAQKPLYMSAPVWTVAGTRNALFP